jgi:hypothetical protein
MKTIKMKNEKTQPVKPEATPQPSAPAVISHAGEPWPPDMLLDLAYKEPNRRALADYNPVIRILRDEKKFTFREIAEWLRNYHVEADHNAVYREYTKGMPDDVAHDEALVDEHLEKQSQGLE